MQNPTVLVVDDEAVAVSVAQRMLEKLGCTALGARTSEEAMRLLEERGEAIDVVLLDLSMPGMDGGELLEGIRRLRADLAVIVCSGYGELDVDLRRLAPSAFLQKPFTMKDLAIQVRKALEQE